MNSSVEGRRHPRDDIDPPPRSKGVHRLPDSLELGHGPFFRRQPDINSLFGLEPHLSFSGLCTRTRTYMVKPPGSPAGVTVDFGTWAP